MRVMILSSFTQLQFPKDSCDYYPNKCLNNLWAITIALYIHEKMRLTALNDLSITKRSRQYLNTGVISWYKSAIACSNFINMAALKVRMLGSDFCKQHDLSLKLFKSKVMETMMLRL